MSLKHRFVYTRELVLVSSQKGTVCFKVPYICLKIPIVNKKLQNIKICKQIHKLMNYFYHRENQD